MASESKFLLDSIQFNLDMIKSNHSYILDMVSMTTYQKIDELYDIFIYLLDTEQYEDCNLIQKQLQELNSIYKEEIRKQYDDRVTKNNASSEEETT